MDRKTASLVKIFKALSDGNRIKILSLIHRGEFKCKCSDKKEFQTETCIKDLSHYLNISIPTISHHVKELVNAGLITTKKDGKWLYCRIDKKGISKAIEFLKF